MPQCFGDNVAYLALFGVFPSINKTDVWVFFSTGSPVEIQQFQAEIGMWSRKSYGVVV